MCTLFIYRSKNTEWPIFIANNRDEYLSRTFMPPGFHWDKNIFAGKDNMKGGTWLGINKHGLCAAILNRSSNNLENSKISSRGYIIIEALKQKNALDALSFIKNNFKKNTKFFNLFISDYKNSFWIKYKDDILKSYEIPYGFSIIDNYDLNDARSKKQLLYKEIFCDKRLPNPEKNNFKDWQEMLFLEKKYDNINLSSVFVTDPNNIYGTVCSSIIGLPNKDKIKDNIIWLYSENKSSYKKLLPFKK